MLAMEQDVVPEISPAKEFLPLLEEKLKKLLDQRDEITQEIMKRKEEEERTRLWEALEMLNIIACPREDQVDALETLFRLE